MKPRAVLDVETYRNYWLLMLRDIATGDTYSFERSVGGKDFDPDEVRELLNHYTTVGFNSWAYDLPVIFTALSGGDNKQIKKVSDLIIQNGLRRWDLERHLGVSYPEIDHIDIMNVLPGQGSLKLYGARLHAPKLQDLPIPPNAIIKNDQVPILRQYCGNDLDLTIRAYRAVEKAIALRETLGEQYGEDLRSKSDAQIAEAVIKKEVGRITGSVPRRPEIDPGTTFQYQVPGWVHASTPALQHAIDVARQAVFRVADSGRPEMPDDLDGLQVSIGDSVYRMGIGGLHSSEKNTAHVSDDEFQLIDRDVASYYPSIILNEGLYPKHLGKAFLKVYRTLVERRLAAKRSGDKTTADSLKITINGTFGKLGSKWSVLYSPHLLIQVTLTGQLALLMLIEKLETHGIPVVSANTDGIVIKCPREKRNLCDELVADWELNDTGFETEDTEYAAFYSRDVNNYIAVKPDGSTKGKGVFATEGLMKNPVNRICVTAVVNKLTEGKPVADTVMECDDIRQFLTVRTVKGGGVWGSQELGRVVRWVNGIVGGPIRYKTNGNQVATSENAWPAMDIPDLSAESIIDRHWYIEQANDMLEEIGYVDA